MAGRKELQNNYQSCTHVDPSFLAQIEQLPALLDRLLACAPFTYPSRPTVPKAGGIYLFTEADKHLYVGRTGNLRQRLGQHCQTSSGHNSAPFTFLLAREASNQSPATYRSGQGRDALMKDPTFARAFSDQNARVNRMLIRYVQEADAIRQTLLELYAAMALRARYNDFDNH